MRLTGKAPWTGLAEPDLIRDGSTYVLALFDGLGVAQLDHPGADVFREARAGTLEAPFPTTTSVSKATIASGLPPSRHGLTAHLAWMEDIGMVVNTLKWVTLTGEHVDYPYEDLIPGPNLWERLRVAGIEPIVVEPGAFANSPLSRVLFRGARFEGIWDEHELVEATVQLSGQPGRLVIPYVPEVDFAAHVYGLESAEFSRAMGLAVAVWEKLADRLGPEVVLLGTADHGLAAFSESQKLLIRNPKYDSLRFAGDPRGVQLWGDPDLMEELAEEASGTLVDPADLIGPGPTRQARARLGQRVLLPPDDLVILPPGFDKRLSAYHGGLSRAEVEIPLLVG